MSVGWDLDVAWLDCLGIAVLYLSLDLFLSAFPSSGSELPWEPARPVLVTFLGSVILTDEEGVWEGEEGGGKCKLYVGGVLELFRCLPSYFEVVSCELD